MAVTARSIISSLRRMARSQGTATRRRAGTRHPSRDFRRAYAVRFGLLPQGSPWTPRARAMRKAAPARSCDGAIAQAFRAGSWAGIGRVKETRFVLEIEMVLDPQARGIVEASCRDRDVAPMRGLPEQHRAAPPAKAAAGRRRGSVPAQRCVALDPQVLRCAGAVGSDRAVEASAHRAVTDPDVPQGAVHG